MDAMGVVLLRRGTWKDLTYRLAVRIDFFEEAVSETGTAGDGGEGLVSVSSAVL